MKIQPRTNNTRRRMTQFNWITRTYVSPVLLNTFNPHTPDLCAVNIRVDYFTVCVKRSQNSILKCISQSTSTCMSCDQHFSLLHRKNDWSLFTVSQTMHCINLEECWLPFFFLISAFALEKLSYVSRKSSSEILRCLEDIFQPVEGWRYMDKEMVVADWQNNFLVILVSASCELHSEYFFCVHVKSRIGLKRMQWM